MGFGKFLKKVGRVAKKGVGLAMKAGIIPGTGAITQVVASKLQTLGANRQKLRLAKKGKLVHGIKVPVGLTKGAARAPAWQKSQAPVKAAKQIQLTGAAKSLLEGSVGAKREATRKASVARLETIRNTESKIAKLSPAQKEALADEFQASGGGTPAQFRQFLASRL